MELKDLEFVDDDARTTFLMQYIPHRIQFLDSNDKHTVSEILGGCWDQHAPEERPKIERVFASLIDAGELAVFPSGFTPDLQPLYALRPLPLH